MVCFLCLLYYILSHYYEELSRTTQTSVILLHIVMVSPETHFVKNHESQSRTSKSQLKKKKGQKLKVLGP